MAQDFQNFKKVFAVKLNSQSIEKQRQFLKDLYSNSSAATGRYSFDQALTEVQLKHPITDKDNFAIAQGLNEYLGVRLDPHTYIMPKRLMEEAMGRPSNKAVSAGVTLKQRNEHYVVTRVLPGSSAALKGVKIGDIVTQIESQTIGSQSSFFVQDLLAGPEGSLLKISFQRGKQTIAFELKREWLKFSTVESSLLSENKSVGYIRVFKFSVGTCKAFNEALVGLLESNIQGLLVDLRDNPGGPIDEAACIAESLVKRGQFIVEARDLSSHPQNEVYISDQDPIFSGPVAVLVNASSASSSEVLAGALQDNERAIIVGERTYGKGTFQRGRTWGHHVDLALFETMGIILLPSGRALQLQGVIPDIEISKNKEAKREDNSHFFPLQVDHHLVQSSFESPDFDVKCRLLQQVSRSQSKITSVTDEISDKPIQKAVLALECLSQGLKL